MSVRPIDDSLDDLVHPGEERRRDRQAEGLGGLEVDDKLELRLLQATGTNLERHHGSCCSPVEPPLGWLRLDSAPSSCAGTRIVAPQVHDIHTASSPCSPDVRAPQRRWVR